MKYTTCDHIGLFTQNASELTAFYTGILGFELANDGILPRSIVESIFGLTDDCRFIKLSKNDFMIELFQPLSTELRKRIAGIVGINHWGYSVSDRTAFVEKMRKEGQQIVEVDRNGRSVYFLIDPDGNRIEIRERTG